jgi:hypothetical protein
MSGDDGVSVRTQIFFSSKYDLTQHKKRLSLCIEWVERLVSFCIAVCLDLIHRSVQDVHKVRNQCKLILF